jgi:regulator of replication initiation timing
LRTTLHVTLTRFPTTTLAALQAKKNVVSGKVFEAHEEINKTQETLRGKDQQIQQLTAVAEHLRGENEALRAQLQQAQAQAQLQPPQQQQHQPTAAGRLSDAGTPLRAQLQLPLQQMLAQQQQQQQHQAAVAALSSRGGGLSEATVNGSPMAAGGGGSPFTGGVGATDSPQTSKIGRMRIDKTPPRDQDDQFSLAVRVSGSLRPGEGLAVYQRFSGGFSSLRVRSVPEASSSVLP